MKNQRKESRKKLVAFTPVYDLPDGKLLGYVGDLTPQGVMVIGEHSIQIDKLFTLGINLLAMRVVISARAAWCKQDHTYFNTGFEFLDVSTENAKMIESILTRYQFRQITKASDFKS